MLVAAILSAWLEYGADGMPHARAVTSGGCPVVYADGRALAMRTRASPGRAFVDTVCDARVPATVKQVRLDTRTLPAPVHDPHRIVVLGDTGCRINNYAVQSCDDPEAWPFPRIARSIAAVHPDLVIHVGDYLYREHACPEDSGCDDSPHGDDGPAWDADFLHPAAPLFAAAPLVLMRGNHEECDRNGGGWFRYLDPRATTVCSEATPPYAVDLGSLRLVAFDSAIAEDRASDPAREPIYRAQFATLGTLARGAKEAWFVTHRPPYTNRDERRVMGGALAPFDAVLSGHIHFFAAMNVTSQPPLVINGEGGTKLDPNFSILLRFIVGRLHVTGPVFGSSHFGFGVYTRTSHGWSISLRDPDGKERARCTLAARTVACRNAP